jgi:hypothetical protein
MVQNEYVRWNPLKNDKNVGVGDGSQYITLHNNLMKSNIFGEECKSR